ncbi:hypothetical protein Catovirus_1_770 [Catovirus CTV1]|uniref:Uncharacterized protein n=1 Tax=Catovirus CTV1 TaxID=1977631 RepID=A0A1V0SAH4_9VIRU|nr:hypothetical protein Catovirus_1_770 [Catovirus CTV1]
MSAVTKIIDKIIWKSDWETKFGNTLILDKWREESKIIGTDDDFNMAIRIIRAMLNRRMKDKDGNYVSDREILIRGLDDREESSDEELDYDKVSKTVNPQSSKKTKKKKLIRFYTIHYIIPEEMN